MKILKPKTLKILERTPFFRKWSSIKFERANSRIVVGIIENTTGYVCKKYILTFNFTIRTAL